MNDVIEQSKCLVFNKSWTKDQAREYCVAYLNKNVSDYTLYDLYMILIDELFN